MGTVLNYNFGPVRGRSSKKYLLRTVPKLCVLAIVGFAGFAGAQTAAPKVSLEGVVDSDGGHAGGLLRVAFEVELPRGFHVNSDEPREEFLIPTRLLLAPPVGVTVQQISYPEPTLFKARFSKQALSVFEERFRIAVSLGLGEELEPGAQRVVATLRYQACTERVCYPPAFTTTELEIPVLQIGIGDSESVPRLDVR